MALVGIGNQINGDDGAGVLILRILTEMRSMSTLNQQLPEQPQPSPLAQGNCLLVEAGLAPENFTGTLRRFQPDLVVLIDAADMGLPAGEIACLDWRDAGGWSASTHTLPLNMVSAYLVSEVGCQVMVLGIQPLQTGMEEPLSQPVERAVAEIVAGLQEWIKAEN